MFKKFNISTRFIVLFGSLVAMLFFFFALEFNQLNNIRSDITNVANRDVPTLKIVTEITKLQLEQNIQYQRLIRFGKFMIVNQDAKKKFLTSEIEFSDYEVLVTQKLTVARSFLSNIDSKTKLKRSKSYSTQALSNLKQIKSLYHDYMNLAEQSIESIFNNNIAQAEDIAQKTEAIHDQISKQLEELLNATVQHAILSSKEAQAEESKTRISLYVVGALFLLITVFLAHLLRESLLTPLNESLDTAEAISNGQRSIRFPEESDDEIGLLGKTINKMLNTIEDKERELIEANEELEERVKARTLQLEDQNKQLDINNKELDKLNRIKNEFLGMAAHDMRTPLAIIIGYTDLYICGALGEISEDQKLTMQKIKNNGQSMLDMINDLLDISIIESGQLQLNLEIENHPEIYFADCVDNNQIQAKAKLIKIDFDSKGSLPPLKIDKERIRQVMNNLISNAIKFSFENSEILVSAEADNDNKEINITVTDHGQGIPSSEIQNLFKEYGKTSVKATAGEKSTGLGLAIVRKIIEAHGSKVWVESEVGKGSTFHFSLPTSTKAS